jgi:hypothetical protein
MDFRNIHSSPFVSKMPATYFAKNSIETLIIIMLSAGHLQRTLPPPMSWPDAPGDLLHPLSQGAHGQAAQVPESRRRGNKMSSFILLISPPRFLIMIVHLRLLEIRPSPCSTSA